jgi:hypothetical protein
MVALNSLCLLLLIQSLNVLVGGGGWEARKEPLAVCTGGTDQSRVIACLDDFEPLYVHDRCSNRSLSKSCICHLVTYNVWCGVLH